MTLHILNGMVPNFFFLPKSQLYSLFLGGGEVPSQPKSGDRLDIIFFHVQLEGSV